MPDARAASFRPRSSRWPAPPREHGFWVMLAATVITAVLGSTNVAAALLVAICVAGAAVFAGGLLGSTIRKREGQQLAAAIGLSLTGVPIALAGGTTLRQALATAVAWAVVFSASALSVRATFARAARGGRGKARLLTGCSVLIPLTAAALFAPSALIGQALAALVAAAGAGLLAVLRPGVKRLKAVGLSLAGIALAAAVALLGL